MCACMLCVCGDFLNQMRQHITIHENIRNKAMVLIREKWSKVQEIKNQEKWKFSTYILSLMISRRWEKKILELFLPVPKNL